MGLSFAGLGFKFNLSGDIGFYYCCHGSGMQFAGEAAQLALKEQYPVTAHVLNFDFWTGCREFKRCEESKRTLKNPFASCLAEFYTTMKPLRITD